MADNIPLADKLKKRKELTELDPELGYENSLKNLQKLKPSEMTDKQRNLKIALRENTGEKLMLSGNTMPLGEDGRPGVSYENFVEHTSPYFYFSTKDVEEQFPNPGFFSYMFSFIKKPITEKEVGPLENHNKTLTFILTKDKRVRDIRVEGKQYPPTYEEEAKEIANKYSILYKDNHFIGAHDKWGKEYIGREAEHVYKAEQDLEKIINE